MRALLLVQRFFRTILSILLWLYRHLIQFGIDHFLTNFRSVAAAQHGILLVSTAYLGNLLVGWSLSILQVKSAIAVGQRAMNDLRLQVFEHIQRLSLNYFDKTHQGRIISRVEEIEERYWRQRR